MYNLEEIKAKGTFSVVAKTNDLNLCSSNKRSTCLFCNSSTGFVIREDKYYRCYRCNRKGNVIDFVREYYKLTFGEALDKIAKAADIKKDCTVYASRTKHLTDIFRLYQAELNEIGTEYLKNRGLLEATEKFPVGYVNTENFLVNRGYSKKLLEELGLLTTSGHELFRNHLVFAYRDLNGSIVHLQGRSMDKEANLRWISTKGGYAPISNSVWGVENLQKWRERFSFVFLCEGLSDCYSLLSLGLPAIATAGINVSLTRYTDYLKGFKLICFYDNDRYPIGSEMPDMYKSWSAVLPTLINLYEVANVEITCLTPPEISGVKDVNSFLKHLDFNLEKFLSWASASENSIERQVLDTYSENKAYWHYIIQCLAVKKNESYESEFLYEVLGSGSVMDFIYDVYANMR